MEYLMTYGWAILIVAVVLASLYYLGVFNSSSAQPNACLGISGFTCTNTTLYSTGLLSATVGEIGTTMTIDGTGCSNSTTEPTIYLNSLTLTSDQQAQLAFFCPVQSSALGSPFSGTLWVEYTTQGSTSNQIEQIGSVKATVIRGATVNGQLAIDGSSAVSGTGPNYADISLSTSSSNDVIVVYSGFDEGNVLFGDNGNGGTAISSITDTAGLTWYKRSQVTSNDWCSSDGGAAPYDDQEVWYAISPNPLTNDQIQVNYNGNIDDWNLVAFGVSGANINSPWVNDGSLPSTAADTNGQIEGANAIVTVSTPLSETDTNTMLLGFAGNDAYCQDPSISSGEYNCQFGPWTGTPDYTSIGALPNCGGNYGYSSGVEYKIVTTPQATSMRMYDPTGRSEYWSMIGDAITAK